MRVSTKGQQFNLFAGFRSRHEGLVRYVEELYSH